MPEDINKLIQSDSIKDKFLALKESNGSIFKAVFRANDGKPIAAAIFVNGVEESGEIVQAIESIEASWE